MVSSRDIYDNDSCPVRDELLGEMYRASEHGLPKLVESVSSDVRAMLAQPRSCGLTFRLADRFGDHGLIALVLAVPSDVDPQALRIDTLLMSCRVIGRTTEQFILRTIMERAREMGYERLIGEFIPTSKNKQLVADLYDRFGFSRLEQRPDGSVMYCLDLTSAEPPITFIRPVAAAR